MGRPADDGAAQDLLQSRAAVRQANFLELFVDLVLVFALSGVVSRVVRDFSGTDSGDQWRSLVYLLVLALPLIWLWITTARITSWFDARRPRVQLIVLASAFGLLIMAASLPGAFVARGWAFALPYVILHIGRPLVLVVGLRGHALRALYLRSVGWYAATAGIWIGGACVSGDARAALWGVAALIDAVAAQLRWPVPGMERARISAWATESSHHLPERFQQFLMIALGESVLAVGITFTDQTVTAATCVALVVAFLTTVLLWRIYFYRCGHVLGEAVSSANDRLVAGRATGLAHVIMVVGIIVIAVGYEIVQKHPTDRSEPAWLGAILGGPALFLYGRIRLEQFVYSRLSWRRVVAIAVLAASAVPLTYAPTLLAGVVAALALLGISLADARGARRRPEEPPTPSA